MNVALRKPRMSREQFFVWAETQATRYEFDGFQPVAMTGGTVNHSRITLNLHAALRSRLHGKGCEPLGPDAGVRTLGDAIRYPDALVTCTKVDGAAREVPGPVVVFEVLSPGSGHVDRIVKLLEYRGVPSILRYVIVEYATAALTLHARGDGGADWTTTALIAGDTLKLPEIGIDIPVADLFAGTGLEGAPAPDGG
jgi:Uma2 family endonuclease